MPALADLGNEDFIKFFYVGDSSTGKTGSLVSLAAAGYRIRMLDMDNGIRILRSYVKEQCPDQIGNIDYMAFRDEYKFQPDGQMIADNPKAFKNAAAAIDKWEDGSNPASWGPDTFFVLDTLTTLGKAALNWAQALNPTTKDPRQWYNGAQRAIENIVAELMGENFRTNVIIITHISERELTSGERKGFPASGAGTALGPTLAKYTNTMVLAETVGFGEKARRRIKTLPTGFIDLKTGAPFAMKPEYPLETGLADIVKTLKEN